MKTMIATAALGLAAGLPGLSQAQCFAVGGPLEEPVYMEGYVLTEATAGPELMARPPAPEGATGILCVRDTIIPHEKDFELLHHGMGLLIRTGEGEDETILSLGFREDQYVVQLPRGSITDADRDAIVAVLESFNEGEAALAEYMAAQNN